jgi:transcriptional regulator with XRE-family HTH domain
MPIHQTLLLARKQKGLTQEELAEQTKLTVRTIQRIENGENIPRAYTLKALAAALDIGFDDLKQDPGPAIIPAAEDNEGQLHFLQLLILSCFSYIVLPFLHFLIPAYMLRNKTELDAPALRFARKLIRGQVQWIIVFHATMLATVAWNLFAKKNLAHLPNISYLTTLFVMYAVNAVVIILAFIRLKKLHVPVLSGK